MYRLILVDDEKWALAGLEGIIPWEDYGFKICGLCRNAQDAFDILEKDGADAVFTDIRMPGMSGETLIAKIRQLNQDTECVIVSAYSDFETARRALEHHASGYLLKPLEEEEVRKTVLRIKARLDSRRKELPILSMDNPAAAAMGVKVLQSLLPYPWHIALLLPASAELPQPGIKPIRNVEFSIKGAAVRCFAAAAEKKQDLAYFTAGTTDFAVSKIHGDWDLVLMFREASSAGCGGFRYAADPKVSSIQFYLGTNYGENYSLGSLASRFYVSENYLGELFKKHTGNTLTFFIHEVKLQNACRLLEYSDLAPKEIAECTGFNDLSYFGRIFKSRFGITAAAFRNRYGGTKEHYRDNFFLPP
ncbi:MAG: response regulator [Treponema sp.]|jgi:two-component system response regulator YesN|nr:response regulator [Treponema sp.]